MRLNEQALFWLDSWVNPKTNTNEIARENARAVGLHIAALQERIQGLEREGREYREHVQSHCEHDWAETLHGPDTVGEHCFICGVDRDYDDSDGYESDAPAEPPA